MLAPKESSGNSSSASCCAYALIARMPSLAATARSLSGPSPSNWAAAQSTRCSTAVGGPAEQVRDPRRRQHLGEIGDSVEVAPLDEPVDERIGDSLRVRTQIGERSRCQRSTDDLPLPPVLFAVAHQRGTAAQAVDHVVQRNALTRDERGGVAKNAPHIFVPGRCIHSMSREPDERPGITKRSEVWVGIVEGVVGEEVGLVPRDVHDVRRHHTHRLRIVPIPSIQVSRSWPGRKNLGGCRVAPMPAGVPVKSTSPGSSGRTAESSAIKRGTLKMRSEVRASCTVSPSTAHPSARSSGSVPRRA